VKTFFQIRTFFKFLLIATGIGFAISAVAQRERCGTTDYIKMLHKRNLVVENEKEFEGWLRQKLKSKKIDRNARTEVASYKVQVVVHVIHNGEAIGKGTNIPASQIHSQLKVLNDDFNRLNADTINTPSEFKSVAGRMNIEFALATTNPNGQLDSGIVRVKGSKSSWVMADNLELKSLSYWPAENYLNIWVCNLTQYLGFTQFPESTLGGLNNSATNRLTDGMVISHKVFGSINDGNFDLELSLDLGRTVTHEMGHFFGLRHIWGDTTNCLGTDYVADTPPQNQSAGCPVFPQKDCPDGNPIAKMFQNYLDYTDDACMNIFSRGQVERMQVVLENSPRRFSLLLPNEPQNETASFQKIFSPNGDGINDYWKWTNTLDYQGCRLSIFNRFGRKVYEAVSYENNWDGRSSDGLMLEAEAYYYIIQCDGKKEITGGVRIVR
jgi:gliding motility-associated-like protein